MAEKIRIKHLTNSLYQMERWSRFLRLALYKMDPETPVGDGDRKTYAAMGIITPPPLADGCPPAMGDHPGDCCCPDCCAAGEGDGKEHGKGHGKGKGKGKGHGKSKSKHKK
jgi:hypothetical protein